MQIPYFAVLRASQLVCSAATRASVLSILLSTALTFSVSVKAQSAATSISDDELLADELLLVEDTRPVVYLTFDDGPSADTVTEDLLQVLARHNATATFFVTGQRVRRARDKVAEIIYAGHAIGNHTLTHAKLTEVSDKKALSELTVASEIILSAGGPPATCFRPPFGSTDKRINGLASQLGMVPVGWSVDTRDWDQTTSSEEIANALNRVGAESIVLLHDGPTYRGKMLSAFSDWMDNEAHRFQFRALPQCIATGVQLAEAQLPAIVPVVANDNGAGVAGVSSEANVSREEPRSSVPAASQEATVVSVPEPAPPIVLATIPELLAKIRAYRFELYDDGQRVDLTQVTATLDSEIHGDHVYYSF